MKVKITFFKPLRHPDYDYPYTFEVIDDKDGVIASSEMRYKTKKEVMRIAKKFKLPIELEVFK